MKDQLEKDDLPAQKNPENEDDDQSFTGQIGLLFGAVIIVAILLGFGAFFALGGIHAIEWLWTR